MAMPRSITTFRKVLVAAAVLTAAAPFAATAASAAGGDGETVKPVAAHDLPNLPGKRLTAVVVTYAPGAKSARHHHPGTGPAPLRSAAITAHVTGLTTLCLCVAAAQCAPSSAGCRGDDLVCSTAPIAPAATPVYSSRRRSSCRRAPSLQPLCPASAPPRPSRAPGAGCPRC